MYQVHVIVREQFAVRLVLTICSVVKVPYFLFYFDYSEFIEQHYLSYYDLLYLMKIILSIIPNYIKELII